MKIKSISKQALAVLLSLSVLASTLMLNTFSAFATNDPPSNGVWGGTTDVADKFDGGDGTKDNPYQIANASQLALFGSYLNTKTPNPAGTEYRKCHYKLMDDILLNNVDSSQWAALMASGTNDGLNEWTYGTEYGYEFYGTFNGNGHTIKGMYMNSTALVGFIRTLHGTVENLGIEDSYIKSTTYQQGAIAARLSSENGYTATVRGCYSSATVKVSGTEAGGIAGGSYSKDGVPCNVIDCYSNASVTATKQQGAIVGASQSGTLIVTRCYTTQALKLVSWKGADVTTIEDCYTTFSNEQTDVKKLTADEMTGKVAEYTMPKLFEGENSAWEALEGMTPQLKKFEFVGVPAIWKGINDKATKFAVGSGTDTDPYLIFTPSELALFAYYLDSNSTTQNSYGVAYKNCYYKLMSDILLNNVDSPQWAALMASGTNDGLNEWTYGADSRTFYGTFDGNGHKIKGMYVNSTSWAGFIRNLYGTVENLGIEDSYIKSTTHQQGAIAARLVSDATHTAKISNCYSSDTVKVSGTEAGGIAGGFWCTGGVISDCYSNAIVTGSKRSGAIVGVQQDSGTITVTRCYTTQDLPLVDWRGGNNTTITDCYTTFSNEQTDVNKLTVEDMKGADAVANMKTLFTAAEGGKVVWYVMTGETPKLLSFTGLDSIQTGDLNLDDAVNILDLVKLAQRDSGAVINESNEVIIGQTSAENPKAALKLILLG